MADLKDWKSLSAPHPEWVEAVKSFPGGKAPDVGEFPDIPSLRSWFTQAKAAAAAKLGPPGTPSELTETTLNVPMRDGVEIKVRVHAPKDATRKRPLAVVFHGGGFCIGDLGSEELLCRNLAKKLDLVVVNVDYRLGPEWKFPTSQNDAVDAVKWAVQNLSTLNADPSLGFLLSGTSAGGQLVAVAANIWRDENLSPPITGCHYMVPCTVANGFVPERYLPFYHAYEQNKDAAILSRGAIELFFGNYLNGGMESPERGDKLFSPLLFEKGVKGLPPAYFQICGMDPLRDDGLIFEKAMREEEGIKTKVDVYPGLPHAFWSSVPGLEVSRRFVEDSVKGVEWLLELKK